MLPVDLRDLHRGPVDTIGRLDPGDPTFTGLMLELDGPVEVQGRLQQTGHDEFLWRASLNGRVRTSCRRCLKDLRYPVHADVDVLFSADPDASDDPSVYPLASPVMRVDVRDAIREELALAVSGFPLCREDCAGLCPRCGADLNAGPCGCTVSAEPD